MAIFIIKKLNYCEAAGGNRDKFEGKDTEEESVKSRVFLCSGAANATQATFVWQHLS